MKKWIGTAFISIILLINPIGIAPSEADSSDTVILVLDASGSMSGDKIESAVEVGRTFLTTVPTGIKVGLVTFNSKEVAVLAPTSDYNLIDIGLSQVKPEGDTSLYDGILSAIRSIASGSSARIVVITDGDDTASDSLPAEVVLAISQRNVFVDVVTVGDATKEIDVLKSFSQAGNGRLLQTEDAQQLADVFTKVLASAPANPSPSSSIPATSDATVNNANSNSFPIKEFTRALIVFILIFSVIYSGIRFVASRQKTRDIDGALETYSTSKDSSKPSSWDDSNLAYAPDKKTKKQKKISITPTRSKIFPEMADRLDRSGFAVAAERWIAYWVITGFLVALVLYLMSSSKVLSLGVAIVATPLIHNSFLKSREEALKREFEEQLADFLTTISSGLRAGLSFAQAVESSVGEGTGEIERQFRRALAQVQVGATLDSALSRVAERMNSDDLSWTIAALRIQREVGGNLAKILDTASTTIRNRAELKREVRTLSAEGRMSAYVLVALPIGIFVFLMLSRREYVQIFWTEPIGMFMLAIFGILVTAGWFWIRSIVTVKV